MKRPRVKRLIACAIVGVVATYLTSWLTALAWQFPNDRVTWALLGGFKRAPPDPSIDATALLRPGSQYRTTGRGVNASRSRPPSEEKTATYERYVFVYGYPMPCLRFQREHASTWSFDDGSISGSSTREYRDAIRLPNPRNHKVSLGLPLRPVWPGFAVNAALYAGVCWVLLATPGFVVRWRRRRNGRCPACGYDLAGLDRCSECGGVP